MSDCTKVAFWSDDPAKVKKIKKYALSLFDAISVEYDQHDYWDMTISELDLKESLEILDKLKKEFNLTFVISYGVY